MVSNIDLCNQALTLIGCRYITEMSEESSEESQACLVNFAAIRDSLLAEHRWSFCIRRASLVKLESVPAFDYDYIYAKPSDMMTALAMKGDNCYKFKVCYEGIETSNPEAILLYAAKVEDPNQFTQPFKDAFVSALAARLAYKFLRSGPEAFIQAAEAKLKRAKMLDSRASGSNEQFITNDLLESSLAINPYLNGF